MLSGLLTDEALHKCRQMDDQQQHFETRPTSRAGMLQAQPETGVLRIAERLFYFHSLRIEADDRIGRQVLQQENRAVVDIFSVHFAF